MLKLPEEKTSGTFPTTAAMIVVVSRRGYNGGECSYYVYRTVGENGKHDRDVRVHEQLKPLSRSKYG